MRIKKRENEVNDEIVNKDKIDIESKLDGDNVWGRVKEVEKIRKELRIIIERKDNEEGIWVNDGIFEKMMKEEIKKLMNEERKIERIREKESGKKE